MAPVFTMSSYVTFVSMSSAGIQPPEGPPICTALNFLSFFMPPPILYMTSLRGIPSGTSQRPPFFILPASANTLVPLLSPSPNSANLSPPFLIIHATLAKVSTLLIFVGFFQKPFCAGKGGFNLGIPRSPSMDAISAVSSPHTNAPAPAFI